MWIVNIDFDNIFNDSFDNTLETWISAIDKHSDSEYNNKTK